MMQVRLMFARGIVGMINPTMRPGVTQKVFRGDNVVIVLTTLHPGMETAPHRHPWEQLFMILKGRITLHIEEQVFDCPAGTVIPLGRDATAEPLRVDGGSAT